MSSSNWREIGARNPPDFKWKSANPPERPRDWFDSQKWRVLLRPRLCADKLDGAMRERLTMVTNTVPKK